MARRGAALREHILDTAKAAFLEDGFERTSMDAIAARANVEAFPVGAIPRRVLGAAGGSGRAVLRALPPAVAVVLGSPDAPPRHRKPRRRTSCSASSPTRPCPGCCSASIRWWTRVPEETRSAEDVDLDRTRHLVRTVMPRPAGLGQHGRARHLAYDTDRREALRDGRDRARCPGDPVTSRTARPVRGRVPGSRRSSGRSTRCAVPAA
ncbi:helix-turn-helix domain-containing protein [Amycolatopsis sp. NPDC049159]|uniref:TetR/AcrR family transcriptional regulator n=1 Tax=Amycolatopsis sp. NPDC049159 TaxID=3157210 RepID=UPI0033F77BDE